MTTNRRRAPTSSRPTAVRVRALVGIACAGLAAVVLGAAGEGLQRALAVDDSVMVKMRDGVHLAATVYRPADANGHRPADGVSRRRPACPPSSCP